MKKWNNQSLEAWMIPHLTSVEEVLQATTNLRPLDDSGSDSISDSVGDDGLPGPS